MGVSNEVINIEDIPIEQVQEFYEWLQGKSCPEHLHFKDKLNLTEEQAFSVIYFLQEHLYILPDKYERCGKCGCIYDSDCEGTSISEETTIITEDGEEVCANFPKEMHGTYCEDCRPDWIEKPYDEWIKEDVC